MKIKHSTFFALSALAVAATFLHTNTPTVQAHSSVSKMHNGEVAGVYFEKLRQSGGRAPYHWTLAKGSSLPEGLILNASTGTLSGTPTTAGTSEVRLDVTDSSKFPLQAFHAYSLKIAPEPFTFENVMLQRGVAGTASIHRLVARGGTPPYNWSVASGSLPDGMKLDTATGVLSGTPIAAGTAGFTIRVKDSAARSEVGWSRLQKWSQDFTRVEELSSVE